MNQLIYQNPVTVKTALPFPIQGNGFISTAGIAINGVGTSFSTQMLAGSYLVNLATNEVIKVYRMDSDTQAYLEKPFLANIFNETPQIVQWFQAKVKLISIVPSGNCYLNGQLLTNPIDIPRTGNSRSNRSDLVEPVILDASGGSAQVEIFNY